MRSIRCLRYCDAESTERIADVKVEMMKPWTPNARKSMMTKKMRVR